MKLQKNLLIIGYIILLSVPLVTIIKTSGGIDKIPYFFSNFSSGSYFLLRIFALFGIVLMFAQVMTGAFVKPINKIFGGRMIKYHITQGLLAYLFIFMHPVFYGLYNIGSFGFMPGILKLLPNFTTTQEVYINFGRTAIILLTIGIAAGLLRTRPFITKHWRLFHFLNYVAFVFVLIHSYYIGSDTHETPFIYLYPIFILGLVGALLYRRVYRVIKNKAVTST